MMNELKPKQPLVENHMMIIKLWLKNPTIAYLQNSEFKAVCLVIFLYYILLHANGFIAFVLGYLISPV